MALIKTERRGPIAILTLDRADRLNALPDLGDETEVSDVCAALNADLTVRCVILTGAGRAFSAGGDLRAMRDGSGLFAGEETEIADRYRTVVHGIVRAIDGLEMPLITAINGAAMGLGCEIAGLGDIRIASTEARFGVPFLRLGLIPGDGGAWLLPRHVGQARAAQMLFTGEAIDATTAERWGLVNAVVPADDLMPAALAMAARVAAQPPLAARAAKRLLKLGREAGFEAVLEDSARTQARLHATADHAEGVAAVLDKRPGLFSGR